MSATKNKNRNTNVHYGYMFILVFKAYTYARLAGMIWG